MKNPLYAQQDFNWKYAGVFIHFTEYILVFEFLL